MKKYLKSVEIAVHGCKDVGSRSVVALVKGGNPYRMVKEALELVDIETRVKANYKVLIKPNLVRVPSTSPYASFEGAYEKTITEQGDIIHRDTLEALLKVLHELGVYDITVGEAPGGCEASVVYRSLALYELAEEFQAKLVDLNFADSVKVPARNGFIIRNLWIPKVVLESDFRINLAVLKVWCSTCVSLCLKNWGMGILPGKYYGFNKATARWRKGVEAPLPVHRVGSERMLGQEVDVSKLIVDVCETRGYDLGIIDGLTVQHYAFLGPSHSTPSTVERRNLIVASPDMVAVDAVAARISGLRPNKILHIKWAAERGLGTLDLSKIDVRGRKIEEVEMRCNPAEEQKETTLQFAL